MRLRRKPSAPKRAGAVEALRETWSTYPTEWKHDPALNLGVQTLGEEWGGPELADLIAGELVAEYLGPDVDVLELGCGGGKFSRRLAPQCRSLLCTDISLAMVEHARQTVTDAGLGENVSYQVLNGTDFGGVADRSVDFIFSYDVQLHLQPQNIFSYMLDAGRVLRENGVFMLHQVNLSSEGGMAHFLIQYGGETWKYDFDDPRRRGHIYFMSVEEMRALADQAGLALERLVADESAAHRIATGGRDLIGFMRLRPSRLRSADARSVELLQLPGDHVVHAVIDGRRAALSSARQFENAGFRWEQVREVTEAELAAIPEMEPLQPWE
jgi:2-polyprenyl-3-methyl-5-hydroxy-6-metoxy-1,4-benzoquinol methylase